MDPLRNCHCMEPLRVLRDQQPRVVLGMVVFWAMPHSTAIHRISARFMPIHETKAVPTREAASYSRQVG